MHNLDLTSEAIDTLEASPMPTSQARNRGHAHILRGKILGLLLRKRRLAAGYALADCAQYLRQEAGIIEAWEVGNRVPSLPQLELLASFLDFAAEAENAAALAPAHHEEFLLLRRRLIGTLLQKARQCKALSIEQLSAKCEIATVVLQDYELGAADIPLSHLIVLTQAVGKDLRYFLDERRPARQSSALAAPQPKAAAALESAQPEDEASLAALIRLTLAFKELDLATLKQVAAAINALISARDGA